MTGSKSAKNSLVMAVSVLVAVAALIGGVGLINDDFFSSAPTEAGIELPEKNKKIQLTNGAYLYATDENLYDLLFSLDIFFKTQGLSSDSEAEVFKSGLKKGEHKQVERCVEFKYFNGSEEALTFTLLPQDVTCVALSDEDLASLDKYRLSFKYLYLIAYRE